MSEEWGTESSRSEDGAKSKADAWRTYFRDRGLSPSDIPKALVVHEVRSNSMLYASVTLRRVSDSERGPANEQVVGLTWFAVSWATCYRLQPCKALGLRFFKHRTEQFFEAAER